MSNRETVKVKDLDLRNPEDMSLILQQLTISVNALNDQVAALTTLMKDVESIKTQIDYTSSISDKPSVIARVKALENFTGKLKRAPRVIYGAIAAVGILVGITVNLGDKLYKADPPHFKYNTSQHSTSQHKSTQHNTRGNHGEKTKT